MLRVKQLSYSTCFVIVGWPMFGSSHINPIRPTQRWLTPARTDSRPLRTLTPAFGLARERTRAR